MLQPSIMLTTAIAMLAFAGNSVLCRLALSPDSAALVDPTSFSVIRLLSGAISLALIVLWRGHRLSLSAGSWYGAATLLIYLVAFSFAYVQLDTGVGALILFGVVQLVMLLAALRAGQRLKTQEIVGLLLALAGLLLLLLPGAARPNLIGVLLMCLSGVGWGLYSLAARNTTTALLTTCGNFIKATPFLILLLAVPLLLPGQSIQINMAGACLALISGSITSALGYAIWYRALTGLEATQAGAVQLSVPVLAAIGGVLFVSEDLSTRLVISSALVIGGIYYVLQARRDKPRPT
ncbi:DMT family transporter [Gilvimarinus polysaccharolyticus]|uniref:DMT family transporter n=1 Tax=Gilvimarinus polysaccharolyticus TaxID=863921 RepID=UPI0006738D99|nr:DMT family transporter [Gilvimarinus polysaccharolyticus]